MAKPILTVIAGCNGSGKSTYSSALTPAGTPTFDYDKEYLIIHKSEFDSDIRDLVCHNKTRKLLEERVDKSILTKSNFTYETNFNSIPLYWPQKFKSESFKLRLFFFCLNSIEEAKRRVQIRVENGGHFVPSWEIEERYHLGYQNLEKHWRYFDEVFLFDTSTFKQEPKHFLSILNHKVEIDSSIPSYLSPLIPSILN